MPRRPRESQADPERTSELPRRVLSPSRLIACVQIGQTNLATPSILVKPVVANLAPDRTVGKRGMASIPSHTAPDTLLGFSLVGAQYLNACKRSVIGSQPSP